MSNFNIPDNYFQNHPEVVSHLAALAQETIDKSATPNRYSVVIGKDEQGNTSVTIEDRNPDAIFNESQTGTMGRMGRS